MRASHPAQLVSQVGSHAALPTRAGLGLKPQHFRELLEQIPDVGFFEIHAENYMVEGGPFHHYLERIRARYPLSLHGVGLSIGGETALDEAHLDRLAALIDRCQPAEFSEHLAWSSHGDIFYNDLLPLPYTRQTLNRVCAHIDQVQNRLGRRMLLENPATYIEFEASSYSESQFIGEVVRRSGCGLLLDVNNVHVSCINHGRNADQFIRELPLQSVAQIHLAGFHRDQDAAGSPLLIDSHGAPVDALVWGLYEQVLELIGPMPSLIEWDNDVPELAVLLQEAGRAENLMARTSRSNAASLEVTA